MSEPENDDPYRVPQVAGISDDPGDLQAPGPLAILGIVILSLAAGFTGFLATCFGGIAVGGLLSRAGVDMGAGLLIIAVISMAVGLWLMIVTSRRLYRLAAGHRGNRS